MRESESVTILGFGTEGRSAIDFFLKQSATITVYDEKERQNFSTDLLDQYEARGVRFAFGPFPKLPKTDKIIRSPGIPLTHPRVKQAKKNWGGVTSVTNLFLASCPCPIIGVSGTKGKGTTATALYLMLQKAGKDVHLGGNIGTSPLTFLDRLIPASYVVLELSSFQLADAKRSPHVAVVLMITREHKDYHKTNRTYEQAKRMLVAHQSSRDYAVLNADYPKSKSMKRHTRSRIFWYSTKTSLQPGCFISNETVIWHDGKTQECIVPTSAIALMGKHNWENVCAATAAAKILAIPSHSISDTLRSFHGLPHRLQHVVTVRDVSYYDDSFATTPETTIAAIQAFTQPKILILGGSGKKSDFSQLANCIRRNHRSIRAIIGIGKEWKRIKNAMQENAQNTLHQETQGEKGNDKKQTQTTEKKPSPLIVEGCKSMEETICAGEKIAKPGDVVLLSPACASFDMFLDYKDRGNQFQVAVRALEKKEIAR